MKFILTIIILFLFVVDVFSQVEAEENWTLDSLTTWIDIYSGTNNHEYSKVSHIAISKAIAKRDYGLAARFHSYLSFWNYLNYEVNGFDTIKFHRIKQIEYDKMIGNKSEVGKGYLDLSIDYLNDNQLKNGQDALFQSIEIFKTLGDNTLLAESHTNLAYLYIDMDEPEKALYFCELSLPVFVKEMDYFMMADVSLLGFTKIYLMLKDYESAHKYVNQTIRICSDHGFDQNDDILLEAYSTKGNIYLEQKDYESAEVSFRKAWELDIKVRGNKLAQRNRFDIGTVLLEQDKYQKALPHLIAGVEALEEFSDYSPDNMVKVSECYEKLGLYKEALDYRNKSIDLQKKITDDHIANLESEIMVKYETGRKDQEILEQTEIIAQKNRVQRLSIAAALLFATLLSGLSYFYRKNKKKSALLRDQNKVIEERNRQNEVLLKEIHHRVKNNLQVISSLLNFQSRSIDDQHVKTALLDSQSRVQSMSLIHQKLYRGKNLASVEMKNYLGNLSESLVDAYSDEEFIEVKIEMIPIELDVDFAIPLGLIANELMTNSLKYAFPNDKKGVIKIKLDQEDDNLILEIVDDGIGQGEAKPESENSGFGSELIEMLTMQLKGKLVQTSENGFQSRFKFPHPKAA